MVGKELHIRVPTCDKDPTTLRRRSALSIPRAGKYSMCSSDGHHKTGNGRSRLAAVAASHSAGRWADGLLLSSAGLTDNFVDLVRSIMRLMTDCKRKRCGSSP